MKFPEEAQLYPWTLKLRADHVACQAANVTGQYLDDDHTIMYDEQRPFQVQVDTLVHELLHVVWSQSGANALIDSIDANSDGEKLIRMITPRVISLLKDNPWLIKAIVSC